MSEYKKVKIGDFLTEREGRYKPDDEKISNYKRLEKIDFSGVIHISDKASKTDMIIVHPGDLVISGINVAKGAVAVYQGNEPVCATIHYSSYTFDDKQVDLEYFKYFVKSDAFISALQKQVKGGIKTEIKPKHLLPLEITIPDLEIQKEIVKKVSINLKNIETLTKEIESQKAYAKQLRQNILQDAIEGKLTAEWRKTHPVIKGNPDFDAEALFEEIQKEKKNDKKQKALAPIGDDEKPFEIPEGWKWVRLGEIIETVNSGPFGTMIHKSDYSNDGIPLINPTNIKNNEISDYNIAKVNHRKYETMKAYMLKENHIVLARRGDLSKSAIITNKEENWLCGTGCFFIKLKKCYERYFITVYTCSFFQIFLMKDSIGQTMPNLNQKLLINAPFPLPPYEEQKKIVNTIETLRLKIEQLEQQITQREEYANQLMQSILKDAFEER